MNAAALSSLSNELDPRDLITGADMHPYLHDWRNIFHGAALAVCFPRTTAQVAAIVRICREDHIHIVPQGGNTGLAGGATPDATDRNIVVSLARMNRITSIDRIGQTVTAQAGVIIDTLRSALADVGRDLPISFGATGSATVGGVIATNAGGANVMQAGMAGSMVLGLEVVLPDGSVLSNQTGLHKDNSGYNWPQIFVGSEGTLGLITAAVFRTRALARVTATALLAVPDIPTVLDLFGRAVDELGESLSTFELISAAAAERVEKHLHQTLPLRASQWLVLVEAASTSSHLTADFSDFVEKAFLDDLCNDGAMASNETQRKAFWHLRESLTEAEAASGPSVKHDISVPVTRIPEFLDRADAALARYVAETSASISPNVFGHVGDGNLHYNILTDRPDLAASLNRAVHDVVAACGGSITAEHGIGQYRLAEAYRLMPATQLHFQENLKAALDPHGLFNPGKLVRSAGDEFA